MDGRQIVSGRSRSQATLKRIPACGRRRSAKALNVPRCSVTRTLPALEDAGRLLYEDGRGRLWPFGK